MDSPKTPFWTTVSPHDAFAAPLTCPHTKYTFDQASGKKKAHKHKLFCLVGLGTTPGLSRRFHRVCPWDKSGENLGHTRVFSLFDTVKSPGQSRGRRAAQKVYVKKVYVPSSLAKAHPEHLLRQRKAGLR